MPKIIKIERPDNINDGMSVQIKFNKDMTLWFDVYREDGEYGDITGDWNKYIFNTLNEQDTKEHDFMYANNDEVGAYNYATALELASNAFEAQEQYPDHDICPKYLEPVLPNKKGKCSLCGLHNA